MNRNDFPQLQDGVIYLDNAATTFKPKCVIERIYDRTGGKQAKGMNRRLADGGIPCK